MIDSRLHYLKAILADGVRFAQSYIGIVVCAMGALFTRALNISSILIDIILIAVAFGWFLMCGAVLHSNDKYWAERRKDEPGWPMPSTGIRFYLWWF